MAAPARPGVVTPAATDASAAADASGPSALRRAPRAAGVARRDDEDTIRGVMYTSED